MPSRLTSIFGSLNMSLSTLPQISTCVSGADLTPGEDLVVDFHDDRSGLVGECVFVLADLRRDFSGKQDVLVVNRAFEDFVDGCRRDAGRADVLGACSGRYGQHSDGKAGSEKAGDQFFLTSWEAPLSVGVSVKIQMTLFFYG